jgi:acetylglutamate kinase
MIDTSTKEEVLIEALPYIQKYEGTTFVIKYGGAAMTNDPLKQTFAKDVTLLRKIGINIVIVHGGGKEITDTAHALGIPTRFVKGQRYTDEQMISVVLMVLAGKLNKGIVTLINRNGGNAVGLCGADHSLLQARKYLPDGDDLGLVGEIVSVNISFLNLLLQHGMMPVVAPLGVGDNGTLYNINADLAASAIASALRAEKLVYLSDIEGVLVNNRLVSTLTKKQAETLIREGAIFGGMIPKVQSAFATLETGVNKVHIIDGRVKHSLLLEIFTDEGIGTQMIHHDDQEQTIGNHQKSSLSLTGR